MRQRILFVDDDPAIRRIAARYLEAAGYEVIAAEGEEGALEQFEQFENCFALVLLDGNLGQGKTSLPLLKRLRHQLDDLLIVSTTSDTDLATEMLLAGCDERVIFKGEVDGWQKLVATVRRLAPIEAPTNP